MESDWQECPSVCGDSALVDQVGPLRPPEPHTCSTLFPNGVPVEMPGESISGLLGLPKISGYPEHPASQPATFPGHFIAVAGVYGPKSHNPRGFVLANGAHRIWLGAAKGLTNISTEWNLFSI